MTFSIDFGELVLAILAILLIVGTLPFTATWVGVLFLLTMCKLKVTWSK